MERNDQMIEFYEDLYELLNQENSRIYNVFTETLNALSSIFTKNGDLLTRGEEQADHKGNKTYYWNVVSVPDIVSVVDGLLDKRDTDDLIRDFSRELLENSSQWVKENEIDIVRLHLRLPE